MRLLLYFPQIGSYKCCFTGITVKVIPVLVQKDVKGVIRTANLSIFQPTNPSCYHSLSFCSLPCLTLYGDHRTLDTLENILKYLVLWNHLNSMYTQVLYN